MPNLVQLSNELEYVPKEQLAQMSQDPSSRFPQYLVLSEIQRRTANEKAYAAAKPQPTTTVAEEVVGEFMQPKGLQAGMPSGSAPTDIFSSESIGMPASAPMQQPMQQPMMGMAEGGKTNFGSPEAVMSQTGNELKRLRKARKEYQIDDYGRITQLYLDGLIDEDQMSKMYRMRTDRFLEDQERGRFKPFYGTKIKSLPNTEKGLQSAMEQSRNEMRQKQLFSEDKKENKKSFRDFQRAFKGTGLGDFLSYIPDQIQTADYLNYKREQGLASGGLTAFAAGDRTSLDETFYNPITNVGSSTNPYPTEYIEDEEDLTIGDLRDPLAAATALLALDPRRKALTYLGSKSKGLFNAIKRRYKKDDIDLGPTGMPAGKIKVGNQTYDPSKVTVPRTGVDLKKVVTDPLITVPAGLGTAYSISSLSDDSVDTSNKGKTETDAERKLRQENEAYKKQLDALRNKATGVSKPKKEIDYDLVGLGGLIMGSKNLSDLGMGLAGLAESKQNRQAAKEKLNLEKQLTEAQVMSLKDKSKYSETEALQSYLTAKKKQISEQLDSGLLTQKQATKELEKLAPAETRLIQMFEMLFGGIGNTTNSDDAFMNRFSA